MYKRHITVWSIHILAVALLTAAFGYLYFFNHAWGTWGDDSAGYIFLAGRMHQEQPLVYNDELATEGIQFFGDHRFARWLAPTHHEFINPDGTIASKYPTGSSWLLYAGALITGNSEGFYIVTPALAVLCVLLLYMLVQVILPNNRFRQLIGVIAAAMLGLSNLFFEHAVAQPMREIPSIAFLLLFAVLFIRGLRYINQNFVARAVLFIAMAGLAMGVAISVRETSMVLLPAVLISGIVAVWQKKESIIYNSKKIFPYIATFFVSLVFGIIPIIINSYTISIHKEAFKTRDTSGIALLSNANHVQSLSLQNVFDNQGKFAPREGALPHYWNIIQKFSPFTYFLALTFLGVWFLWQRDQLGRAEAVLCVGWIFSTLTIFSLWINPYSRYIMPVVPMCALLASIGIYAFLMRIVPAVFRGVKHLHVLRFFFGVALIVSLIYSYVPFVQQIKREFALDPPYMRFKSITQNDLHQLMALGDMLKTMPSSQQPVLMFSGEWQFGTSETFEAHTGVKAIRYPLEQRYVAPKEQVEEFLQTNVIAKRNLYLWVDSTSSPELYTWIKKQHHTLVQEYDFSFQPDVKIYHIEQ